MLALKTFPRLILNAAIGMGMFAAGAAMAEPIDWSGFYLGLSTGAEFDHSTWKGTSVGPNNVFGVDPTAASKTLNDGHPQIGGFAGWATQIDPHLLLGVEIDLNGMPNGGSTTHGLPGVNLGVPSIDTVGEKQNFDGALRGRLGYILFDDTLLYGTGGVAYRAIDIKGTCPSGSAASWCGVAEMSDMSKTKIGWTVGAGAETRLVGQWTARLDYRYARFGSSNATLFGANNSGADAIGSKIDLTSQIVTIGIAYHFGN